MIKEKYLSIKIAPQNIKYYKSIYIDCNVKDVIQVPINLVSKGSHTKITAICDNCGNEKKVPLKNYIKCINTSINLYFCNKCSHLKNKQTILEKHGVEHYSQTQEYKNKYKQTILEKHGVEHYSQTQEYKDKCKRTSLKNHGCDFPFQSPKVKLKIKKTINAKYKVDYPMQSKNIQIKSQKSVLKKYNVSNISHLDFIKDMKRNTVLNNYGVEYPMQSTLIKEKRIQTCISKYNTLHEMQNINYYNNWLKKSHKTSIFKNTNLHYQSSYELDFLNTFFDKIKIENGLRFQYLDQNLKPHYYFSDFYLPDYNLILEIKSDYTYNKNKEINLIKKASVLKEKYNFLFIINCEYSSLLNVLQL